jgi:isoaspartyl peptidase/L-asparaginase-like protein (Ntn-hydrolase superfamily)
LADDDGAVEVPAGLADGGTATAVTGAAAVSECEHPICATKSPNRNVDGERQTDNRRTDA